MHRVAVVCDVRGGEYFAEIERVLDELGAAGENGSLGWGGYPGNLLVIKGTPLFPRRTVDS